MKAIIVVDMQNGFMTTEYYQNLKNKINKLLSKNTYNKIIFTKFINDKSQNPLYQDRIGWNRLITAQEQDLCINIPNNAIIFHKFGYGLQEKDLQYIKSLNISEIDICGLKSNACVYAISLQLWDAGIFPNILVNYVECNPQLKQPMEDIFIKRFGKVDYTE